MLTDTTFWIDLLEERRDKHAGPATLFLSRNRVQELTVSIITWGELAEGFATHADLHSFLRGIRVLMPPQQIAWEASRIQRELAMIGGRIGENDSWIAATARAWGHRLITRDAAFGRVQGLNIVRY